MSVKKNPKFRFRSFVSVVTALSALALTVTGALLFVVPPGRIANWTGWRLFGLTKDQWQAFHISFAVVFVLGSLFHVYFNWRPLMSYFKDRPRRNLGFRWEWVAALVLCAFVCTGVLVNVAPFSTLMTFHETIKQSWDETSERPPIPHAELMTLEELAGKTGADLESMKSRLAARGIPAKSAEATLEELARGQAVTPRELYLIALGNQGRPGGRGRGGGGSGGGRGFGRLTLQQFCNEEGLDFPAAVESLNAAGVIVGETMTLRDIADELGVHPSEIQNIIAKEPE